MQVPVRLRWLVSRWTGLTCDLEQSPGLAFGPLKRGTADASADALF